MELGVGRAALSGFGNYERSALEVLWPKAVAHIVRREQRRTLAGEKLGNVSCWRWLCYVARLDPDLHGLDNATLVELFAWSESEFNAKLAGSAIRRIGYERWLRNLAVGLGNALRVLRDAPASKPIATALQARADHPSALVREHVAWALSCE